MITSSTFVTKFQSFRLTDFFATVNQGTEALAFEHETALGSLVYKNNYLLQLPSVIKWCF
jgi:hypothetical protein